MKEEGFTFIELLVAVSIFSVIAVAIYSAFSTGVLAWHKGEAGSRVYQDARSALELMASELKNCMYHSQLKFSGAANEISFPLVSKPIGGYSKMASGGSGEEGEPSGKIQHSIFLVTYYIEQTRPEGSVEGAAEGAAFGTLMRKQEEFLGALARISAQESAEASGEEEEEVLVPAEEVVEERGLSVAQIEEILPEVQGLGFQYCYVNPEQEEEFEWRDSWGLEEAIPRGVKITLSLPAERAAGEGAGGALKFAKFVFMPSGSLGEEGEERPAELKNLLEERLKNR